MDETRFRHIVNRSLTVPGKGHDGNLKEETKIAYAKIFADATAWYHQTGRSLMPWTSEALAEYAAYLLACGYAPATVKKQLSGVRTQHRKLGHPVPDDVAAWHVLRSTNPTGRTRPKVKPVERSNMAALAATCDQEHNAGRRDRCLLTLAWDFLMGPTKLVALNIDDIGFSDQIMTVRVGGRTIAHGHDHNPPEICPIEAAQEWIAALRRNRIHEGALFRRVRQDGMIARVGATDFGPLPPDARLTKQALARVWAVHIAQAGIPHCTPHASRVGGAIDDALRGVPPAAVVRRGGWSFNTPDIVHALIEPEGNQP
jgi:integrase